MQGHVSHTICVLKLEYTHGKFLALKLRHSLRRAPIPGTALDTISRMPVIHDLALEPRMRAGLAPPPAARALELKHSNDGVAQRLGQQRRAAHQALQLRAMRTAPVGRLLALQIGGLGVMQ